jgi:hypothetical protein
MSETEIETLELHALAERVQLHQSLSELKSRIAVIRNKLDIAKKVRERPLVASALASIAGLLFGYAFAGTVSRP